MNEVISILLASFSYVALNMFWYSPAMFGNTWCKARGFLHEDIKNKKLSQNALLKSLGNAVVIAIIFMLSSSLLQISTIESYLRLAFIAGVLGTTNEFAKYIWEEEKITLVILNSLYLFVGYVLMVSILFYT